MLTKTLSPRRLRAAETEDGFTLIELVVSIAILLVVTVSLTGIVISYLKTTTATQSRFTESHDIQFAAAYWQRDVSSIGVRSTTYDSDPAKHSFPLLRSVGVSAVCADVPSSDLVVRLAWSTYVVSDPTNPVTVTVTYVTKNVTVGGIARKQLLRQHCTGSTQDSLISLANNLIPGTPPTVACPGAANGCTGTGSDVPTIVTLTLSANDRDGHNATNYSATLTGERRST